MNQLIGERMIEGEREVMRDKERGREVLSSCQSTGWIKHCATRRALNFFAPVARGHIMNYAQLGMASHFTCIQPILSSDSDFSVRVEHPLFHVHQVLSKLLIVIV